MISSKALYSKYFKDYSLTPLQLEKLQQTLFSMLKDFRYVCDKYGIDYMLCGGTLLGAVRHKGFIPWDDDIDIMMLREEYEKFAPLFRREFSDKYELAEPGCDIKYIHKFPKIFLKNSLYTELPSAGIGKYNRIFLDIFPVENTVLPGFGRKLRSMMYDFACKASSLCADFRYPSPDIIARGKTVKEVRRYYNTRRALGLFFSCFFGMKFYLSIASRLAACTKDTGYKCIPSGIRYSREVFKSRLFCELTTAEFCGEHFKIPCAFDEYLRNLYGDYMQIPPPEKREIHTAAELKFSADTY